MSRLSIVIVENKQRQERVLHGTGSLLIRRTDLGPSAEETRCKSALDPPENAAIRVGSPHVSQKHAMIRHTDDGRIFVKDLDSLNGTFLRLPPYQEVELVNNFELLIGQDVVVQRQNSLWQASPSVGRFACADDFVRYLRLHLKNHVSEINVGKSGSTSSFGSNGESLRQSLKCTRVPLLEPHAYLFVSWKDSTFSLEMERWLQTAVFLYNSGASRAIEDPWKFLAVSPERRHVLELARHVAAHDGNVLLYGRSGAGKDVLARDIHEHSARAKGPFVPLNCAALPKELVEGELFGTVKGGFSGAVDRAGLFEQAHNGTLFLDEIGELPLDLQPKLLRVLDSKRVRRVGDPGKERYFNVRVIAATNRNLERMVQEKTFREDLRFRLDTIKLVLPDLRASDIRALVPALLEDLAGPDTLSDEEQERVACCAERTRWAGNARHLRSALERYLTFRVPQRDVESNWHFALGIEGTPYEEHGTQVALPDSTPQTEDAAAAQVELPEEPMAISGHIDNLIFLSIAREILPATRWGALAELGRRTNRTGAGAACRLKKLGITTDPAVDIEQIDAKIAELRAALNPSMDYLRRLLAA